MGLTPTSFKKINWPCRRLAVNIGCLNNWLVGKGVWVFAVRLCTSLPVETRRAKSSPSFKRSPNFVFNRKAFVDFLFVGIEDWWCCFGLLKGKLLLSHLSISYEKKKKDLATKCCLELKYWWAPVLRSTSFVHSLSHMPPDWNTNSSQLKQFKSSFPFHFISFFFFSHNHSC